MFGTFKKYFIKAAVKHIRLQKIKLVKYLYQLMHNNNKIHTFKKPSRLNKAEQPESTLCVKVFGG